MELLIEAIFVPQNPQLDPVKVMAAWDEPEEFAFTDFMEQIEALREALANELHLERHELPSEPVFFRINERA